MSETVSDTAPTLPDPQPDTTFGIVAGLYVAALVAPSAGALAWSAFDVSLGLAAVVALGVGTAVLSVTTLVTTRVDGLAVLLGATTWRWALAAVPGVLTVAGLLVRPDLSPLSGTLLLSGVGCTASGSILGLLSHTRYTAAMVDNDAIDAEWHARRSPTYRKRVGALAVGLVVAGFGAFGVSIFLEQYRLRFAGQIMIPMAAGLAGAFKPTHYRTSTAGLETKSHANRTLVPWETFTGYRVTDEAIVVHRRYRLLSVSFDREDVDTESVVAALDRYLDAR